MNRAELQVQSENKGEIFTRLLFVVLWTQDTIMLYISQIMNGLPLIGGFSQYFTPFLMFALFLFALKTNSKKIRSIDIVFMLFAVAVIFFTMVFFTANEEYVDEKFKYILLSVLPMYLYGVCYERETLKRDLYYASVAVIFVQLAYLLFFLLIREVEYGYNMQAAYVTVPSAMYVFYWASEKKRFLSWLIAAVSFFLMLAYGTRGPLLALGVYFVVLMIFGTESKKNALKFLVGVLFAFFVVLFVSSDAFLEFMTKIADFFTEIGFSTRIFDKFLEGEMADDSGRSFITAKIWDAIGQNWMVGLGFMGDRTVLDGSYAHNLFMEILCSFGLPFGSVLLIFLLTIVMRSLRRVYKKPDFQFVALMVTFVFTKLMFSGSYAIEPNFFLMLGICASVLRKNYEKDVLTNGDTKKIH